MYILILFAVIAVTVENGDVIHSIRNEEYVATVICTEGYYILPYSPNQQITLRSGDAENDIALSISDVKCLGNSLCNTIFSM